MALPKIREQIEARVQDTGDTMTGRLVQTLNGNPYYELNDGTNRWFFQAIKADNASYIGPTSTKALKIDTDGNATVKGNLTVNGSIIGSIQEAVKATQDGNGNVITSTYLPLSGGTITGTSGDTPLYIKSASASTWIGYKDGSNTTLGFLGMKSDGPAYYKDKAYKILHDGNYNSYSPTLTGGGASGTWPISIGGSATALSRNDDLSMTSQGVSWFDIDGKAGAVSLVNDTPTNGWWHILRFNHQNTNEYYTDLAVPFNYNSLYYKRVAGGTVESNKWIQVLDEKNYTTYAPTKTGSGASGTWGINISGNATTATRANDAVSDNNGNNIYNSYEKRYKATIDLTSLNVNTWYPVTSVLPYNGMHRVACVCQLNTGSVPSWSNHTAGFTAVVEIMTVASGWGTTSAHTICLSNDQRHISDTANPPVGFKQFTNSSRACFYCRGGGKYTFETDYITTWTYYTTSTTVSAETIAPVTTYPGIGSINGTTYHYLQSPVNTDYTTYRSRNIAANTSALTSGSTALSNGYIYLQYK